MVDAEHILFVNAGGVGAECDGGGSDDGSTQILCAKRVRIYLIVAEKFFEALVVKVRADSYAKSNAISANTKVKRPIACSNG